MQPSNVLRSINPAVIARLEAHHGRDAVMRQLSGLAANAGAIDDPELWLETAVKGDFHDMTIERVQRCACGSTDITRLSRFVFWNLLAVSECGACGLVLTSPRLSPESMERVFGQFYFDPSFPEIWGQRRAPVFRDVFRLVRAAGAKRVLDVGTAYGHFVRWMEDRGVSAVGTDISARSIEWGKQHLGGDVRLGALAEVAFQPRTFDCVVSLDALYYASDPGAELTEMHRLLSPGGHVILRLRNGEGVAARARREGERTQVGRYMFPAEHLWSFTPSTIGRVLASVGFEVVRIEPAAYSETRMEAVQNAWLHGARLVAKLFPGRRLATQSFNVVAQKRA